ncbi:alkaline phosphatase [Pseudobacteriovorax antillogorgiicola]|uniref:Alkaline phosphatase n=1 Tax=Pseudobacteriovorax antillogorgiicola TaxID=1513793 RepID=A0A1Y6BNR4_9BACT|nr:alkaline phosphatase [Pseudobacteriovorax antillogorgiicola]TCS55381.1 alkaline phosphatase [Pseudobacteriovorax antillogorgiicola]SMF13236.1 alkaline phosphatase [Pseudobacteriovorax antillogorgiicola]
MFFRVLGLLACLNLSNSAYSKSVDNLILVIGDGMGPQQVSLLNYYLSNSGMKVQSQFKRLSDDGKIFIVETVPKQGLVAESASSATQMASGEYSRPGMIGLDVNGKPVTTILEKAKAKGILTGLVSDTRITHATPAAFAAHRIDRYDESGIAEDLIEVAPDLLLSGGFAYFTPKDVNDPKSKPYKKYRDIVPSGIAISSLRKDQKDLLAGAKAKGYRLVFDRQSLMKSKSLPILGLFHKESMPSAIYESLHKNDRNRLSPSLEEMTEYSLDVLSKSRKGFFLMVESGQIDWASHSNDPGYLLHQMLQMNRIIKIVVDFAEKREDTLVVITSDHETGSFSFSYSVLDKPVSENLNGQEYKRTLDYGHPEDIRLLAKQKRTCTEIMKDFDKRKKSEQTPQALVKTVKANYPYSISKQDAEKVLQAGDMADFRKMRSFEESDGFFGKYYNFKSQRQCSVLAKIVYRESNIIWGTAGHTSTPVISYVVGPSKASAPFKGMMHNTKLGQLLQQALGL